MRFKSFLVWCLFYAGPLLAESATQTSATVTFKEHGKVRQTAEQTTLESLAPAESWSIYEPHEKRERTYRVIPFNQMMDKIYGPGWRKAEEILFTCSDGYQPSIPTAKFLKFDAGLAFPTGPGDVFELTNTLQNNERITLRPYYLIWNNAKAPALKQEGASDIPYQLVGIDLISFREKFPNLYPGKNSSVEATRGFLSFRKYCLNCHTINTEGGGKAPELNVPVNVTEYWQPKLLKTWILNPAAIRWNTPMPGLSEDIPGRDNVAQDLMAYLKAMAKNKHLAKKSPN